MFSNKNMRSTMLIIGILFINQACAQPGMQTKEVGPGYLIVTGWYKDSSVQKAYFKSVGKIIRKYGFVTTKFGMPGINLKVIEGDWTPRPFAIEQFENESDVKKFWTSKEYQNESIPIRKGQSAIDVMSVGAAFGNQPILDEKSALLVFLVDLEDREKFMKEYAPYAPAVAERFGGKFLVSSSQWNMELLEGDYPSQSIVVLEFPTAEALKDFWNDKEYKALSEVRKSTGKWSVIEIMPFKQ